MFYLFFKLGIVHNSLHRHHHPSPGSSPQLLVLTGENMGPYPLSVQSLNFLTFSRAHFSHCRNSIKLEILAIKECPCESPGSKWHYPSEIATLCFRSFRVHRVLVVNLNCWTEWGREENVMRLSSQPAFLIKWITLLLAPSQQVFFTAMAVITISSFYAIFTNLTEFGYFVGILQLQWM